VVRVFSNGRVPLLQAGAMHLAVVWHARRLHHAACLRGEKATAQYAAHCRALCAPLRLGACVWRAKPLPPAPPSPRACAELASDPGVLHILQQREWVVGTLGEMDPLDDRLAQKTHSQGKCLLGYNTNHGARIDVRLRTDDLSGFLPYPSVTETLLHELAHNMVGPHNEHFWHLFAQLKAHSPCPRCLARASPEPGPLALGLGHPAARHSSPRPASPAAAPVAPPPLRMSTPARPRPTTCASTAISRPRARSSGASLPSS